MEPQKSAYLALCLQCAAKTKFVSHTVVSSTLGQERTRGGDRPGARVHVAGGLAEVSLRCGALCDITRGCGFSSTYGHVVCNKRMKGQKSVARGLSFFLKGMLLLATLVECIQTICDL